MTGYADYYKSSGRQTPFNSGAVFVLSSTGHKVLPSLTTDSPATNSTTTLSASTISSTISTVHSTQIPTTEQPSRGMTSSEMPPSTTTSSTEIPTTQSTSQPTSQIITTSQTSASQTTASPTSESQTSPSQTTVSQTSPAQTNASHTSPSQTTASPTSASQTSPSQTTVSQTSPSQTTAHQTSVSQTSPSQTTASHTSPSQTTASQTSASQTSPSQTTASQTSASQTSPSQTTASQTSASHTNAPVTSASQTTASQTSVSHTSAPVTSVPTTDYISSQLLTTTPPTNVPLTQPTSNQHVSHAPTDADIIGNENVSTKSSATYLDSAGIPEKCIPGHEEFGCLPESTTVAEVLEMSSTKDDMTVVDLLAIMSWLMENNNIPENVTDATLYANEYVRSIDNLMDDGLVPAWNKPDGIPLFATNLLAESQHLLEDLVRNAPLGFKQSNRMANMEFGVLKVKNLSTYKFQEETAPSDDVIDRSATSIVLDPETLDALKTDDEDMALTTIIMKKGSFIQESSSLKSPNSHVIVHSLQVGGKLVSVPVSLTINLLQKETAEYEPVCSFLNINNKSNMYWDSYGCSLSDVTPFSVSCFCNHTTSFGILMQLRSFKISDADKNILKNLTYILCGFSIVGLMATLAVFLTVRSILRSDRVIIHINLSISMMVAQMLLLLSGLATKNQIVCRVFALLMHYFFLAMFCWMLVEGVHLYLQIVRVFNNGMDRKMLYMLIGWGTPAVVVVIAAGLRWEHYVNYESCWLSMESNVIWAFIGPALTVMLVNLVVLVSVVRIIVSSAAAKKDKEFDHVKAGLKGALFLLPILGLTWIFGILAQNAATLVFQYLFVIFNAMQGVFIFLAYCALNKEVRNAIQRSREKWALTRGDSSQLSTDNYSTKRSSEKGNRIVPMATSSEPEKIPLTTFKIKTRTTTHTTTHMVMTREDFSPDGEFLPTETVRFESWKV
ncbi:adhesion G protein-coupled receptor L4-like [Asterias amurensis]|uniref:adhesion G protein-coupled receptor L4-like n=1 Tax=Asterias amurensis TaxID=7602 RepID=UPI003AB682A9